MMVSVIIATYNRHKKLYRCVKSILANNILPEELVIVDRTKKDFPIKSLSTSNAAKIRYYKLYERGVAKARNFAIKKSKGDIIAITDDDCVVPRDWIQKIKEFYLKNPETKALYGRVIPYFRIGTDKVEVCPSTRCMVKHKTIRLENFTGTEEIDFILTSNFSCRRELFEEIGLFLPWLGVSSIGQSSEDNELCLRMLENNICYTYAPSIKVYHNRWVDIFTNEKIRIYYARGWVAMWIYYYFFTNKFRYITWKALSPLIKDSFNYFKVAVKFHSKRKNLRARIYNSFQNARLGANLIYEIMSGLILGLFQISKFRLLSYLGK